MQPQEKRLTKQQIQGILDKTPKSIETADVINGLLGRGFILEGLNDQPIKKEPNLAQKTADMAVGWASNFGNTASAYLGAGLDQGLGKVFGKEGGITGTKSFGESVDRIKFQNGKDTNVAMNDLFGRDAITRDLSTSEGRQGFGGDILSGAATVFPAGKSIQGATLGAKAVQGAKIGATVGALSGAGTSMQEGNDLATVGKDALVGAGVGGAFGAAVPVAGAAINKGVSTVKSGAKKVVENVTPDPAALMQRVARISKGKQAAFKETAGESVGDYLVNRGIFGTQDEVATKLFDRFQKSKQTADDALAKLQGKYKSEPVKTALEQLLDKKVKISSPGAMDPELNKVKELFNKNEKVGLSMSEINEVKRLYERGVKLDFVKENLPTEVQRASNIDNAIRSWQFEQADRLGLKNLPEINKETRLARQLLDDIGAENAGSAGNNLISLTDWVMLAGGDPTAIGGFLIKKGLTSQTAMSAVAKKVAPKLKISESSAVMQSPQFDPKVKSFADFEKKITQQSLQKNQSNIQQLPRVSNLEDISYNEAIIPRNTKNTKAYENPLIQVAKKYKSAEEFIKAQGTPVYHGTKSNIDIKDLSAQTESRGQYLGNGIYFTKYKEGADFYGGKTLSAIVNEKDFLNISNLKGIERTNKIGSFGTYKQYLKNSNLDDTLANFKKWQKNQQEVADKILNMGYKGVTDGQQHVIFDKSAIKTKSQLEQIWKEANIDEAIISPLTEKVKEVVSKDPSKAVQVIRDILSSVPDMSTLNRNELIKELTDLMNSLTEQ